MIGCTSATSRDWITPTRASSRSRHSSSSRTTRRSSPLFAGGEILAAGARTIASGGWQSLPTLEMPGALLIGDAGGTLNFPKIKGIHQAMRSGMLAAEHLAETGSPKGFDARWRASVGGRELHKVRNIAPGMKRGLCFGLVNGAWETYVTAGNSPWTLKNKADFAKLERLDALSVARSRLGNAHSAAARSGVVGVLCRQYAR